ncbi:GNAT family N-acetyltransferase [Deinococcus multiflagellatus]|uniref:GNAT family N-acetyltransferase n=1 Tax=Deinococcus multiflagellatus TaxID=1656887 RepID=A0ABW1ZIF9_9DEIO|nr:GNAT family N-acetyltransferase [Deinococcus multiflagellatus]MBZ9713215.1 GNAT family N-acetyltransferase [Deinococcus multiflagellatus]
MSPPVSPTIRPLRPADFAQVRPMLLDMGFVDDEAALAERFPAFCAHPDWALLGAFQGGQVLGYAAAHDTGPDLRSGHAHRTAKLHDLYTHPAARRQGVGRALMREVEAWARGRGLRHLYWYANLREATPAYVGMGYTPGDEVQEGYRFFELDFGAENTRRPHPERGQ